MVPKDFVFSFGYYWPRLVVLQATVLLIDCPSRRVVTVGL